MYTPSQWKYELMFLGSESDSAYPQSFSCWSQACGFLGGRIDVEEARRVRHVHPPALRAGQNAGGEHEHEHACPVIAPLMNLICWLLRAVLNTDRSSAVLNTDVFTGL